MFVKCFKIYLYSNGETETIDDRESWVNETHIVSITNFASSSKCLVKDVKGTSYIVVPQCKEFDSIVDILQTEV